MVTGGRNLGKFFFSLSVSFFQSLINLGRVGQLKHIEKHEGADEIVHIEVLCFFL